MNTEAHLFYQVPKCHFFSWERGEEKKRKKGSVLLMSSLFKMNRSCIILITGKTWGKKLFVASPASYVSQGTELLYFCKLFHILTCLHNKPSLQKRLCLKVFQAVIHTGCLMHSTVTNWGISLDCPSPVAALLPDPCLHMKKTTPFVLGNAVPALPLETNLGWLQWCHSHRLSS